MGKQWLLYKVTSDEGATGGCNGTTNTKSAGKTRKRRGDKPTSSSSSSFGGCMSAIFHMFDNIQQHHLPFHQPHTFISESSINVPPQEPQNCILKGVEAPRNSLELEQEKEHEPMVGSSSSSLSTKVKQETNFNIPMGGIKIKTKRSRLMDTDVSSECSSSSPSTKTPSLVARLMGLDLLPENSSPRTSLSSPRPSSSSSHTTPSGHLSKLLSSHKLNARSLPVTPRASTGSRTTSTEVDFHHHRLSLQSNKEDRLRYDDNTSEYAKQIAKQVRENISRRVGADITNTINKKEQRRDELLVVLKPKRPSQKSSAAMIDKSRNLVEGYGGGKENEACSPRLGLLEMKNNFNKPISNSPNCSPLSSS